MKKNMYKRRLVIGTMLFSIFIILCQSTNATQVISKSQENYAIKNMTEMAMANKINSAKECIKKIKSVMSDFPTDGIQSLHDIVMMIWEIISIFIGHNVISMLLTRLICCWFVLPIVVFHNILNINISDGGFWELFQECLDGFDYEYYIYTFGALALLFLPIYLSFVFIICLIDTIVSGNIFEGGILDKIKKDLEYIYTPDFFIGNFKPDNNNKSNYSFNEYLLSSDIKGYYYHIGLLGMPMIISILLMRFVQLTE